MNNKLVKLLYISITSFCVMVNAMEQKNETTWENIPTELKSYILSLTQEGNSMAQILKNLKDLGTVSHEFRYLAKDLVNNPEAVGNLAKKYIEEHPEEAYKEFFDAAMFGKNNVIKALIIGGIDVNAKDKRKYSHDSTALMRASLHGNIEIVKALLKAGADVNAKDTAGENSFNNCSFFRSHRDS